MNRRLILKTVSASIASLCTGARENTPETLITGPETGTESTGAGSPLQQILPPVSFFADSYEDVTTNPSGIYKPFRGPRNNVAVSYVKRELNDVPEAVGPDTELRMKASRIETTRDPDEDVATLHDNIISGAVGYHEPPPSQFTDWVSVERSDELVDGHRRSVRWVRRPQLFDDLTKSSTGITKPYIEVAVIVQSTSWGVLETEIERRGAREERGTLQLAHRVVEYMYERARQNDVSPAGESS